MTEYVPKECLKKEYEEMIKAADNNDWFNAYYFARDGYEMAQCHAESDSGCDEHTEFFYGKMEEYKVPVLERLNEDVNRNPLGRLLFGNGRFRSACCEKMREAMNEDFVIIDSMCMPPCTWLVMNGKYLPDMIRYMIEHGMEDDVEMLYMEDLEEGHDIRDYNAYRTDEDIQADWCPFCGARIEFSEEECMNDMNEEE